MILLALLLQAASAPAAPAATPTPRPAPVRLKTIDAATAVETFRSICWISFRDPVSFQLAVTGGTIPFEQLPRRADRAGDVYRAPEAILTYVASDAAPPGVPTHQCVLRVSLAGAADQLVLARRVATALGVGNGFTRTTAAGSRTSWDIAAPDGRATRLFVATRNAANGRTDLTLTALLLRPR